MDDELRRLERLAKGGDEQARERWGEERARRGMCAGGLDACTVGIEVVMDLPGVAELWWGGRPRWHWSIDRIEDRPGYPEELAILLNSQNPLGLAHGYPMVSFVFRPSPFGVVAFGPCHACEKGCRDPQEVVIDDGPRWGSRVPLWLRRSPEFKGAVAQTGPHGNPRTILDIPTPWEMLPPRPYQMFPGPGDAGRRLGEPRPRMRYEFVWEPWACPCGEQAGRVLVVGDPATAAPFITCPGCGARGYETLIRQERDFLPVRWWAGRAPAGAAGARRRPLPTPPRAREP